MRFHPLLRASYTVDYRAALLDEDVSCGVVVTVPSLMDRCLIPGGINIFNVEQDFNRLNRCVLPVYKVRHSLGVVAGNLCERTVSTFLFTFGAVLLGW
jgi:hypothetical protein